MNLTITPKPNNSSNPEAIVLSDKARFTILTSRLIRMEFDPDGFFEDRPSLTYWYRYQPAPQLTVTRENKWLSIETDYLVLHFYENNRFHWRDLWIELKQNGRVWRYGDAEHTNLGGTTRTLDTNRGPIQLDPGLVSRSGWATVDDSKTLVLDDQLWPGPRNKALAYKDVYFYGYAQDYLGAIKEHQLISGKPGLLPRWALGNWWSRYWAYSSEELLNLMDDFEKHHIPLSVCIVDMDWHKTKTGNASSGWTGYSWNRELFPDPDEFIEQLHARNLKTALNLHPAEGVHSHEDQYPLMATRMGLDPDEKEPIPFDIANPQFAQAYFEILHHPLEEQGVDFWWIDWQQGSQTKIEGLDPLFWLNHTHYYDLARNPEKRPFIFSRWPGLGGQRYPIGFSGDTVVDWSSLDFQPEMTATASNVAYGWWSHDIGGHCEGVEEAELYLRWVQFGVFSPIFRLHSTNNEFIERRPWGYGLDTLELVRKAMQFRHQLIPLLYSANARNAETGEPLILPMYYTWPEFEEAFACTNQYTFCQQLMVAPVTGPLDPDTGFARRVIWLPEEEWTNIFTHEQFQGGLWYSFYCEAGDIPVFAKKGAILPLNADPVKNGVDLPETFHVKVFPGEQGEFSLYEDSGEGQDYASGLTAITKIGHNYHDNQLTIQKFASEGTFAGKLPANRKWIFEIVGITEPKHIQAVINGSNSALEYDYNANTKTLLLSELACENDLDLKVQLDGVELQGCQFSPQSRVKRLINKAKLASLVKQQFMRKLPQMFVEPLSMFDLAHNFTRSQLLAIFESIKPASKKIPAKDVDRAYEEMMIDLRNKRKI